MLDVRERFIRRQYNGQYPLLPRLLLPAQSRSIPIPKRNEQLMNDYTVTLVYDLVIISTVVYADNEDEAKRFALQKLDQECGIPCLEPQEWRFELEGVFA